mmetsp:Transcript_11902/g.21916  ORF Transcript_11902/g.21916 Transcript_11902/m.21916 type:complete len:225 (-) Transcript_11902:1529-2203(-)
MLTSPTFLAPLAIVFIESITSSSTSTCLPCGCFSFIEDIRTNFSTTKSVPLRRFRVTVFATPSFSMRSNAFCTESLYLLKWSSSDLSTSSAFCPARSDNSPIVLPVSTFHFSNSKSASFSFSLNSSPKTPNCSVFSSVHFSRSSSTLSKRCFSTSRCWDACFCRLDIVSSKSVLGGGGGGAPRSSGVTALPFTSKRATRFVGEFDPSLLLGQQSTCSFAAAIHF